MSEPNTMTREYEIGRISAIAMARLSKADAALKLVFTALIAGGHLDAAQIVNRQRLHIVQANRDFLAIAKKGDTSTLLGWSDQAIRKG
jgi:hypothetical protein